jgi:NAD(P)-dependent dehydrogenase (short-subunit alcohol dehydrogenase family)
VRLEGKVAIVTGGGQGIGRGIVQCLAEEGADVAIIARHAETARKAAAETKALGRKALAIAANITKNEDVTRAVKATIDTFGKVDILVNNVGGGSVPIAMFMDLKGPEWNQTFELNIKTQVAMCRAVVPYFIKQKSGKIVNISSVGGKRPAPRNSCYGATKAGVIYFSRALAVELAEHNINVNCVCPGGVFTPTYAKLIKDYIMPGVAGTEGMTAREFFSNRMASRMPLKRELTPEDVGHAVAFLVSEDARNITGVSLDVDGGSAMA